MRQVLAKAERRDIRRALGVSVAQDLSQQQQATVHVNQRAQAHADRLDLHEQQLTQHWGRMDLQTENLVTLNRFRLMGFWARLHWLVRGV